MTVLEVKNLHVGFLKDEEYIAVLQGVNFHIEEHKTLALVGESGSGKTQTARCIMRLLANNAMINQGSIHWMNQDLLQMSEKEIRTIRGKEIAMIFQNPQDVLDPVFTIGKQLRECSTLQKKGRKQDIERDCMEVLKSVQIADVEHVMSAYPFQLSLGMCQRVMIAMAMLSNARLWLVDEATSALDMNVQMDILKVLKKLQKQRKLSMLFITHDLRILSMIADEVAIMFAGEIVEFIQSEQIFEKGIAHHPYTQTLLDAMDYKVVDSEPVESKETLKQGCFYATRCRKCQPLCLVQKPLMKPLSNTQKIRCHFI